MNDILTRWRRAAQRAEEEQVRVLRINDEYRATSSSMPFGSYLLAPSTDGWACGCIANSEYGLPCKHLWVLAEMLDLDVLADVRLSPELLQETESPTVRLSA